MPAASRRLVALALALGLGACAPQIVSERGTAVSFTEGRFQVTWEIARTKKGAPVIAGSVQNTRGNGVANIRVKVDSLDDQGQVIATTTGLAPGYVGGFSNTSFEVPIEKTGTNYRVSILGWDSAGNGQ